MSSVPNSYVSEADYLMRERQVYPSDMRVKVSPTGLYTYPDVSVACENPTCGTTK